MVYRLRPRLVLEYDPPLDVTDRLDDLRVIHGAPGVVGDGYPAPSPAVGDLALDNGDGYFTSSLTEVERYAPVRFGIEIVPEVPEVPRENLGLVGGLGRGGSPNTDVRFPEGNARWLTAQFRTDSGGTLELSFAGEVTVNSRYQIHVQATPQSGSGAQYDLAFEDATRTYHATPSSYTSFQWEGVDAIPDDGGAYGLTIYLAAVPAVPPQYHWRGWATLDWASVTTGPQGIARFALTDAGGLASEAKYAAAYTTAPGTTWAQVLADWHAADARAELSAGVAVPDIDCGIIEEPAQNRLQFLRRLAAMVDGYMWFDWTGHTGVATFAALNAAEPAALAETEYDIWESVQTSPIRGSVVNTMVARGTTLAGTIHTSPAQSVPVTQVSVVDAQPLSRHYGEIVVVLAATWLIPANWIVTAVRVTSGHTPGTTPIRYDRVAYINNGYIAFRPSAGGTLTFEVDYYRLDEFALGTLATVTDHPNVELRGVLPPDEGLVDPPWYRNVDVDDLVARVARTTTPQTRERWTMPLWQMDQARAEAVALLRAGSLVELTKSASTRRVVVLAPEFRWTAGGVPVVAFAGVRVRDPAIVFTVTKFGGAATVDPPTFQWRGRTYTWRRVQVGAPGANLTTLDWSPDDGEFLSEAREGWRFRWGEGDNYLDTFRGDGSRFRAVPHAGQNPQRDRLRWFTQKAGITVPADGTTCTLTPLA